MTDIGNIGARLILAKCENRQEDLLDLVREMVAHPHQGPAKEIFLDLMGECYSTNIEEYQPFLFALVQESGE